MANRLVKHDAGPAGPENDGHFSRRGRNRAEIDERLAQRLIRLPLPTRGIEISLVSGPAAAAGRAGLHLAVVTHDNRDIEAHERTDIRYALAIRSDDLDRPPFPGN